MKGNTVNGTKVHQNKTIFVDVKLQERCKVGMSFKHKVYIKKTNDQVLLTINIFHKGSYISYRGSEGW